MDCFYFSHDYNAREDVKILNMLSKLGWEGYGIYWMLIEKLAEANGKLRILDNKGIAFSARVDEEKLILLENDFELFENDGECFWSNRILHHIKTRQKLSNIRAKSGKIGGEANAKQMLSKVEANAKQNEAKERKGKETKIKQSKGHQSKAKDINTLATTSVAGLQETMAAFYEINPGLNFGNKSQRDAAEWLINKYGLEKTLSTIKFVETIRGDKYAPTITTPLQLKEKLGALIAYSQKNSNKPNVVSI